MPTTSSDPTLLEDCSVVDSRLESITMADNVTKGWVLSEIRKAVDSFRPHGWRKITHALREWGLASAAMAIPIALLGIACAAWYFALNEISKNSEFRGSTVQRLSQIENRQDKIDQKLLAQTVAFSGSDPELPSNQERARDTLDEARQESIQISPKVIEQAGKQFIGVAGSNPNAWSVAIRFLEYRSFLNVTYRPEGKTSPLPSGIFLRYRLGTVSGKQAPILAYTAMAGVPSNEGARYNLIGVDKNSNLALGPALLFVTQGATPIDHYDVQNVVFENVEIHYSGGPIILKRVIFINCTFVITNDKPSHQLAEQMLASVEVDFRNPS